MKQETKIKVILFCLVSSVFFGSMSVVTYVKGRDVYGYMLGFLSVTALVTAYQLMKSDRS